MGEPNTRATYITGTIIDSTDLSPLEYASISVINSGTNYKIMVGGISDENGEFSIRHTLIGIPVVTENRGGIKNQICHGYNGYLCEYLFKLIMMKVQLEMVSIY